MTTAELRVGAAVRRRVAEVPPPVEDLLRRAATDSELEPAIAARRARTAADWRDAFQ